MLRIKVTTTNRKYSKNAQQTNHKIKQLTSGQEQHIIKYHVLNSSREASPTQDLLHGTRHVREIMDTM